MKLTILGGVLAGLLAVTTAFPVNEADGAVIGGSVTTPAVGDLAFSSLDPGPCWPGTKSCSKDRKALLICNAEKKQEVFKDCSGCCLYGSHGYPDCYPYCPRSPPLPQSPPPPATVDIAERGEEKGGCDKGCRKRECCFLAGLEKIETCKCPDNIFSYDTNAGQELVPEPCYNFGERRCSPGGKHVEVCSVKLRWMVEKACSSAGCCFDDSKHGPHCACKPPVITPLEERSTIEALEVSQRSQSDTSPAIRDTQACAIGSCDSPGHRICRNFVFSNSDKRHWGIFDCGLNHCLVLANNCGDQELCCREGPTPGTAFCMCGKQANTPADDSSKRDVQLLESTPESETTSALAKRLDVDTATETADSGLQLVERDEQLCTGRCGTPGHRGCFRYWYSDKPNDPYWAIYDCTIQNCWVRANECGHAQECCREGPTPGTAFCMCGLQPTIDNNSTIIVDLPTTPALLPVPAVRSILETRSDDSIANANATEGSICKHPAQTACSYSLYEDVLTCGADNKWHLVAHCGRAHCCKKINDNAFCTC